MKVAIYPGSFNPWHEGHTDVLRKSLQVFDHVIVAIGTNPAKHQFTVFNLEEKIKKELGPLLECNFVIHEFDGLLVDYVKAVEPNAVIRGLRNANDLEFEKTQQYWNEDLGMTIPTFYVVTDRKFSHISSSAIRMVKSLVDKKDKV